MAKPSFGLSDSDILQIRKIITASPLIVIPAKIAYDGQNKWKKCNLFVDTREKINFCKKEFLTDWKYYPLETTVSTMNGTRSLNHFGLNIPIKIGDHTILLDFVQVNDSRYDAGIGSVALDKLGPYTVAKDLLCFHCSDKRRIVPRISNTFHTRANTTQQKSQSNENPSITQTLHEKLQLYE